MHGRLGKPRIFTCILPVFHFMLRLYGQERGCEAEVKVGDMRKATCPSKLCTFYAVTTVVFWRNQQTVSTAHFSA